RAVGASAIGGDHETRHRGITLPAHPIEPEANAIYGELPGIMVDSEADIAEIGAGVVDSVGDELAQFLVLEIVGVDLDRLALRPIVAAAVLCMCLSTWTRRNRSGGVAPERNCRGRLSFRRKEGNAVCGSASPNSAIESATGAVNLTSVWRAPWRRKRTSHRTNGNPCCRAPCSSGLRCRRASSACSRRAWRAPARLFRRRPIPMRTNS